MAKVVVVDPILCGGCGYCEVVCSFFNQGTCNQTKSAIRISRIEPGIDMVSVCHQCQDPPCAKVCPVDAFYRSEKTGALLINDEKCFGCGDCIPACPFGEIVLPEGYKIPVKCDLCNGDPKCVKYCFKGAIKYMDDEQVARERRRKVAAQEGEKTWAKFNLVRFT